MRVQVVDPSAFTPPYDHSLCSALAAAGVDVELVTSRFLYGPVPEPDGYEATELFYRRTARRGLGARGRRAYKLAEHWLDMARFREHSSRAELLHYQWLTFPALDRFLVPGGVRRHGGIAPPSRVRRPRVFTVHYPLPRSRLALRREHSLLSRMDAVIAHSEHGARRLREDVCVAPERVHVIPHGAFHYLTRLPREAPLPPELAAVEGPVVLCFGLIRPYKGIEVLLEAFRAVPHAELWIAGMPRMSLSPLRELAARVPGTVRFVPRFVADHEIPAYFRRADMLVLPYLEVEQSGVLYTALAFGKAIVATAVGGFREVSEEHAAARLVPPADAEALARAVNELLSDARERERLAAAAAAAAAGPYSWDAIARRTAALYRELLSG